MATQAVDLSKEIKQQKGALFNLIVFTGEGKQELLHETVEAIRKRFPCRVLNLSFDEGLDEPLIAVPRKSNASNESEEIDIVMKTSEGPLLANAVLPYLASDLPIYLIWRLPVGPDEDLLKRLMPYAARLIFQFEDRLQRCLGQVGELCGHYPIMDLPWALLRDWRQALYKVFAQKSDLSILKSCRKLYILYYTQERYKIALEPLYLLFWLATRLEWALIAAIDVEGELQLTFRHHHGECVAHLTPLSESPTSLEVIQSIEISDCVGNSYNLIHEPRKATLQIHISHADYCEIPYSLPLKVNRGGYTFFNELLFREPSSHYAPMLAGIKQLVALMERGDH